MTAEKLIFPVNFYNYSAVKKTFGSKNTLRTRLRNCPQNRKTHQLTLSEKRN